MRLPDFVNLVFEEPEAHWCADDGHAYPFEKGSLPSGIKTNQMPISDDERFCDHETKKAPDNAGACRSGANCALRYFRDVSGLGAFLALDDFEFDTISFGKGFEPGPRDRAEMHEDVRASLPRNEAKTFCVVKPLDRSRDSCHGRSLFPDGRADCTARPQSRGRATDTEVAVCFSHAAESARMRSRLTSAYVAQVLCNCLR